MPSYGLWKQAEASLGFTLLAKRCNLQVTWEDDDEEDKEDEDSPFLTAWWFLPLAPFSIRHLQNRKLREMGICSEIHCGEKKCDLCWSKPIYSFVSWQLSCKDKTKKFPNCSPALVFLPGSRWLVSPTLLPKTKGFGKDPKHPSCALPSKYMHSQSKNTSKCFVAANSRTVKAHKHVFWGWVWLERWVSFGRVFVLTKMKPFFIYLFVTNLDESSPHSSITISHYTVTVSSYQGKKNHHNREVEHYFKSSPQPATHWQELHRPPVNHEKVISQISPWAVSNP